ncbi:MAG: hypothetical protein HUU55_20905 [Myxococcales bacterium]|nr:hypothetical protein [Myxococcales bacterium]
MKSALRKIVVTTFVLLVVGFLPTGAFADTKVTVRMIQAAAQPESIHPDLKDLAGYFQRFGTFKSFQPAGVKEITLKLDETGSMVLPSGDKLELQYRGTSKEFVKLRFSLADMSMNIRIHDGGIFFHSGVAYKGGRIILAIRAIDVP